MEKKQKCPLCGRLVSYEFFHEPYTKYIECSECVEFCIDEQSENFFNNTTEEIKKIASEKAKQSNAEKLFILRKPSDSEIKQNSKTTVQSEFIKRKT